MITMDSKAGKTNDVAGAVWLAGLLMTYNELEINGGKNIYFKQSEIQKVAQKLCSNLVYSARISQWCNGDHLNNNYNYLRALGSKRRLIRIGEFNGRKEYPNRLYSLDTIILATGKDNQPVTYRELFEWYKMKYSKMES